MEKFSLATQTLFAELVQRSLDAEFDATFDERGSFVRKRIKSKLYWYYQRKRDGEVQRLYVGPAADKDVDDRVKQFSDLKSDYKQRREMVRALLAAGLPAPNDITGLVVEALWKAGFFRLRGVLVGTAAFQCYSGQLGVRLKSASLMTQDADFAQFYDISHAVGDSIPPIMDVLHSVDPTFEPMADAFSRAQASRFRNRDGYLVEFLTPNRGSDDHTGKPARMPALGGASAQPLRYLDFLIREPVRSVLLFKGGIPVTIPSPERYAVHKLLVAAARSGDRLKSTKDVDQAAQISRRLLAGRSFELSEALTEAAERGPQWKEKLNRAKLMLDDDLQQQLKHLRLALVLAGTVPSKPIRKN